MNPTIELRLKSMIAAMSGVIIPALDQSNEIANEQARLVMGHLYVLLEQHDRAALFERLERRAALQLGRRLVAILPAASVKEEGQRLAAAIDSVRLEDETSPDIVRGDTERLTAAIEALIDSSVDAADEDFQRASQELILAYGRAVSLYNRSWFAGTRFELADSKLPPIEVMIQQFELAV